MPIDKKLPIVIKIGSAVLADGAGNLDEGRMACLADEICGLMGEGYRLIIVSSGAILAGMSRTGVRRRPRRLAQKQALAAIGQVELMSVYSRVFAERGREVGQMLITHEGMAQRTGFNNARVTLMQLVDMGVVPIINENDSVSTEEIRFGENDRLAVLVANLAGAGSVIFLSRAPGLLDLTRGNKLVPRVEGIDADIYAMAKGGNEAGTGGMGSKLMSIDILLKAGKAAFLADGRTEGILGAIFSGDFVGTYFAPVGTALSSRKQWMSQHLRPHGRIWVDEGARQALMRSPASLLLPGIVGVEGHFRAGQLVSICCQEGEFARGMSRLSARQIEKAIGCKRGDLAALLGESCPAFAVHRNDIVLLLGL
ncbi:MAG: glutamate 5-kinase [Planctomycetes bacterium]|nr:glutamate 5-kinase [Planctomycetota bacterium]